MFTGAKVLWGVMASLPVGIIAYLIGGGIAP